jgi:hypothetical protein
MSETEPAEAAASKLVSEGRVRPRLACHELGSMLDVAPSRSALGRGDDGDIFGLEADYGPGSLLRAVGDAVPAGARFASARHTVTMEGGRHRRMLVVRLLDGGGEHGHTLRLWGRYEAQVRDTQGQLAPLAFDDVEASLLDSESEGVEAVEPCDACKEERGAVAGYVVSYGPGALRAGLGCDGRAHFSSAKLAIRLDAQAVLKWAGKRGGFGLRMGQSQETGTVWSAGGHPDYAV